MIDYEKLLNEEQLKPVYCTEGPVLVLAGAGSGKTRVLTYRIAHLIEKGVSPYSILASTFTNKAAKEMQERIEKVTGYTGLQISTFHSFCTRILRQDIEALGVYTKNFSIYDDDNSNKLVTRILKGYELEDDKKKSLVKEVRSHISYAKNYGFDPIQYRSRIMLNPRGDLIVRAYADYQEQLEKNNAVDFDDLLLLVVKLFVNHPEVLYKYQEKYKYIHVDEFQDTNKIQYLLLRMLGMKYQNVFVVGDDDQSIYGWRGADYTNIKKFKEQFAGCQVFKLQRNYRSTKNILNVANKIIEVNTQRMGKTLWTDSADGVRVECKECYDEMEEADYVLGQINGLMKHNNYEPKDFAILVRTSSITRPFEEKLNLYSIPYRLIGGHKFYDRKEIKDFLAYLQIMANPKDEENLLRIINLPKRGIGDGAIEKLREACQARGLSLLEGIRVLPSLNLPKAIESKMALFASVVNAITSKLDLPLDDLFDYVNEVVDFTQVYDKEKEEDLDRLENIDQLLTSVKEFVKDNPNVSLSEYLQSVTLVASDDKDDPLNTNVLTLATVHGVKGLEFKVVFIVGLEDGLFPILRAESESDLEEERRIMYVAVTRAMERLYTTYASSRFRFGKRERSVPSTFLKEAELINRTKFISIDDDDIYTRAKKLDFLKVAKPTPAFAKPSPNISGSSKDISGFKVGQKVNHTRFGEGVILEITGENADIKFEGLGVKKFNLRLAPITRIE